MGARFAHTALGTRPWAMGARFAHTALLVAPRAAQQLQRIYRLHRWSKRVYNLRIAVTCLQPTRATLNALADGE